MECPKCGTENPETKKYCRECGAALALLCWYCGCELAPEDNFCGECGKDLAAGPSISPPELITDAERKQVTALFLDLSGYTAMTERLDPEDVKEITGSIFGRVREVVTKYDGFIERFAGDGVLALFGALKAHEDDPVRAIRAAREIHELVEAMNPRYEAKVGAHISMHSGISTGLTLTTDVNPETGTHSVTGDAINIAARLSSLATANEILVGAATFHRAEGFFSFEDLGKRDVKGKTKPIRVYQVLAAKDEPITIHRLSGLRAKLTGRRAEMAQLQDAVDRLTEGHGSIIAICGDAGTGKSRLVEEFKATLDLKKIQWREGHAYAYTQNIPYFPIVDLMNRAWRIDEGDPPEKVRETIETGVERLLGANANVAPYIGSLYALDYPEIRDLDPETWRFRLFRGMRSVLASLTRIAPTIVCWEDIQWADSSTLDLIRFIISDFKYPTIFLCVYRLPFKLFSDREIREMGRLYEEIRLQELSPSDTIDMLASLLSTESIPTDLRRFIQDKVEGNPFYLEEMANSLIESEILVRDNGDWRLTRSITETDIPSTVQGVIAARLDRLEREMKRILQEASVIGRAFFYEILKRITEIQADLDRSLSGLERLDLVRARSMDPDLEYIFKHALTQEVVYNGLLRKERQEIHERIGVVMEQVFHERLSEFYETLAFHFKQGTSALKAVEYLMKSGYKSLHKYAIEDAHQYYQEAFDLLSNKADRTKEEDTLLIDLLVDWGIVFYYRAHFRDYHALLTSHKGLAESLNDKERLGMFYAWLGATLWFYVENYEESYEYLHKSMRLGEELQNHRIVGYAAAWLAWVCPELGFFDEALQMGAMGPESYNSLKSDQYLFFKALGGMGYTQFMSGHAKKTYDVGMAIIDFGEKHSNIRSIGMGHCVTAWGHLNAGDFTRAIELCQKAVTVSTDPAYSAGYGMVLGISHVMAGNFRKAHDLLEELLTFTRRVGWNWIVTFGEPSFSVSLIATGRMNEGLALLQQTRQTHLNNKRKYYYAASEYILGSVHLLIVLGEGEMSLSTVLKNLSFLVKTVPFASRKAERHFNKAIEVAEEIGAKGLLAAAYRDLGKLHKAKKRKDKARECISKAIGYFELCEAETFLMQAKAELESL